MAKGLHVNRINKPLKLMKTKFSGIIMNQMLACLFNIYLAFFLSLKMIPSAVIPINTIK